MAKILIVDDQIEYLQVIFNILKKDKSCKILRAFDAETAFLIAQKETPHIIITDWDMPETSGIELIKKLKQTPDTQNIPVIMCTGIMTNSNNLKTALDAGALDFIRKPIDEIELLARVNSTINFVETLKKYEQKETEIIKQNLQEKNRKLTSLALILSKNSQKIITVSQEIKKLIPEQKNKANKELLQKHISELENAVKHDSWNQFFKHFESIHNNFFDKLQQICPKLTQNDLRICALLRLNMVTKDISEIVGISPRSVDVARHRIRKKLKLKTTTNLFSFLSKL